MKLPISFQEFKSNPTAAIAFLAVLTVGYLFYELRNTYEEQQEAQNIRIEQLEGKNERYEDKLEELNIKLIECLGTHTQ